VSQNSAASWSEGGTYSRQPSSHAEQVLGVAAGEIAAPDSDQVSGSWRRSAQTYGVDPSSRERPRILSLAELRDFREPRETLIEAARGDLDQLHLVVRQAGYVVLLCDSRGVAIDHRGSDTGADQFKHWGIWLGGVWSEDLEGTNGIGTCVVEQRPITIHRDQHFRTRHIDLSCSTAPIFGASGELAAVLDVSSFDPRQSERSHALALAVTTHSAQGIEERLFRDRFRRQWIIAVRPPFGDGSVALLAVDGGETIIGANRCARLLFDLDDARLSDGISLWSLFERSSAVFRRGDGSDVALTLMRLDRSGAWQALVTPPANSRAGRGSRDAEFHVRPRASLLATATVTEAEHLRGGLAPVVVRRVCEYIDSHLDEDLRLETLANTAHLSMSHFARAFRDTVGLPPHRYVLQRRIDRARQMLVDTETPLSEIAVGIGFADQSHFARHFHRLVGVAPGAFRRAGL
jgi:AraC-like DNA-binding protein